MDPEEEARLAEERLAAAAAAGGTPPSAEGEGEGDPPPSAEGEGGGTPPGDPPPPAEGEGEPPPPAAATPQAPKGRRTFEARIGELSADKRRLASRVQEVEAELARVRAGGAQAPPPAEGESPPAGQTTFGSQEEFQRAVQEEAARQAQVNLFNERCNAVDDAGLAGEWGKERWEDAKKNLQILDDNGRIPYEILSVALETENPAEVLLTLGEDPDRASALLKMTPTKRALEIAKMTMTPSKKDTPKPPPRSQAPEPVEPIRGRSGAPDREAPTDADDDATWLRKREAQVNAQRMQRAEMERKLRA